MEEAAEREGTKEKVMRKVIYESRSLVSVRKMVTSEGRSATRMGPGGAKSALQSEEQVVACQTGPALPLAADLCRWQVHAALLLQQEQVVAAPVE